MVASAFTQSSVEHLVAVSDFAGRDQFAMMHQLRMVSIRRFSSRLLELPEAEFAALKVAVRGLLDL